MPILLENTSFRLTGTTFTEGQQEVEATDGGLLTIADGTPIDTSVKDIFPQIASDCPMLEAMYGISILDHEKVTIEPKTYFYMLCNRFGRGFKIPEGFIPDGSVFWAGYGFNTYLYTRDTAYSSWLGTAYILPDVVKSHLQHLRGLRRKVGLKVSQKHEIPIAGIPTEELDITESEMAATYNTNSYTRRTDDIVWVLGLWEVYKSTRNSELLDYILAEFDYFDQHFYRYFHDESDGLYRGQPTFIDVGGPCYPGRGPAGTVILKALSTNCLYAGCFAILRKAANVLGQEERASAFGKRRDQLAESIRQTFGENGYPFYKYEDGTYSDRQEILGLAFLAIFDILPASECAELLSAYPDGDFGRPLVWPFYGSSQVYHDNSTWPFADTIYALAEYKVGNKQEVIRKTMGKLCRHSLNGNFNEVLEWQTGRFVGCPSYIWSAASYLALVYKMIAGMEVSETGNISFAPVLPTELGTTFELKGLKVAGMTIDLCIKGNGDKIASCRIDGQETGQAMLKADGAVHAIEIHLC